MEVHPLTEPYTYNAYSCHKYCATSIYEMNPKQVNDIDNKYINSMINKTSVQTEIFNYSYKQVVIEEFMSKLNSDTSPEKLGDYINFIQNLDVNEILIFLLDLDFNQVKFPNLLKKKDMILKLLFNDNYFTNNKKDFEYFLGIIKISNNPSTHQQKKIIYLKKWDIISNIELIRYFKYRRY